MQDAILKYVFFSELISKHLIVAQFWKEPWLFPVFSAFAYVVQEFFLFLFPLPPVFQHLVQSSISLELDTSGWDS